FETYVLLANPTASATSASVVFQRDTGGPVEVGVGIPAMGRVSVNAADYVPSSSFTTRVAAQAGIVAERAMYFDYGNGFNGGHVATGATAAGLRWDFAEGSTGGFDTYYLLGNPGTKDLQATVTFRT